MLKNEKQKDQAGFLEMQFLEIYQTEMVKMGVFLPEFNFANHPGLRIPKSSRISHPL